MRTILAILAASAAIAAGGCATEPPPCTAEWMQWRKDRVLKAFASDHRKEINALRDMAATLKDGEGDTAMLSMSLAAVGVLSLAADFVDEAAPAVREAVGQCGSAPRAAQLFADMLRDEGVEEDAVKAIERLGALVETNRLDADE